MRNIYLLKDLARMTGCSTYTVKYYLRLGLLEEIGRSPVTNFRYFDDSNVQRLKEIRQLRGQGLALKDIMKRLKPPGKAGRLKDSPGVILRSVVLAVLIFNFFSKNPAYGQNDAPLPHPVTQSIVLTKKEVFFEAKVLQIILNEEHIKGVDWAAILSDVRRLNFAAGLRHWGYPLENQTFSVGTITNEDSLILLEALETVGVVDVLSKVYVLSKDREESMIPVYPQTPKEGEEVPSFDAETGGGFILYVRPAVSPDGLMAMQIRPQYRFLTDDPTVKDWNLDPLKKITGEKKEIQVKPDHTVVIGSLFKEERVDSIRKIPLLGDLPILGFAFRNKNKRPKKTELIIFLTPEVKEENQGGGK